jgi:FkbM family methyltransferase
VIVVGASPLSYSVIDGLLGKCIAIEGIFDQDVRKHGAFFKGIQVQPFEETDDLDRDIPILLVTHRLLGLQRHLKQAGFHHIWPFPLLSIFDSQCFNCHPFYEGIHKDLFENRDKILWLYEELFDEKSKRLLDAIVGFRLTFDIELLDGLIDPVPYFSPEIFMFGRDEVMIDGGAYNGDSIRLFSEVTSNKFRCIISFEPSCSVFEVLKQTFRNDSRIRPVNGCLFSENTRLLFDTVECRSSAISNSSGKDCQAYKIDDLSEADDITFIKLNIEGAEPNAISGAAMIIRKQQPKLAVAVYHRPDHLWSLAKKIKDINSAYRLYLRQHDGGTIETVLYGI